MHRRRCFTISASLTTGLVVQASGNIYVWKVLDAVGEAPSASPKEEANSNSQWRGVKRHSSLKQPEGAMFAPEPFHMWTGHKKHVIDMRYNQREVFATDVFPHSMF